MRSQRIVLCTNPFTEAKLATTKQTHRVPQYTSCYWVLNGTHALCVFVYYWMLIQQTYPAAKTQLSNKDNIATQRCASCCKFPCIYYTFKQSLGSTGQNPLQKNRFACIHNFLVHQIVAHTEEQKRENQILKMTSITSSLFLTAGGS